MSRPPNFDSAVSTSLAQSDADVTFAVTVAMAAEEEDVGGNCFVRASVLRSAATTLAPSEMNLRVVARPNPEAAPVVGWC
jgi:hypothetical protein